MNEFEFPWILSINFFGSWWDLNGDYVSDRDVEMIELGFRWPS